MRHASVKAILGTMAFGALLAGCATTVELGPGYYHYDTRTAGSPPAVVYQEPAVVIAPAVVERDRAVVYRAPAVIYRSREATPYFDHGQ